MSNSCRAAQVEAAALASGVDGGSSSAGAGTSSGAGPSAVAGDEELCVICLDAAKTHLLAPCGHRCVCANCGPSLEGKPCPVCRERCVMVVKVWD